MCSNQKHSLSSDRSLILYSLFAPSFPFDKILDFALKKESTINIKSLMIIRNANVNNFVRVHFNDREITLNDRDCPRVKIKKLSI